MSRAHPPLWAYPNQQTRAWGGGLGWLMGKHGFACDNLLSVDIVTAGGTCLTASAPEIPTCSGASITSISFRRVNHPAARPDSASEPPRLAHRDRAAALTHGRSP